MRYHPTGGSQGRGRKRRNEDEVLHLPILPQTKAQNLLMHQKMSIKKRQKGDITPRKRRRRRIRRKGRDLILLRVRWRKRK